MKEHIQTINSSFVDYLGEEHQFVIAAVSKILPKTSHEVDESFAGNEEVAHEVTTYIEDYGSWDCINTVVKGLSLGYAICNPNDEYDYKVGVAKAVARAKNNKPVLFVTDGGLINTTMVDGLLEQEAEYLMNNPGKFIKGYQEAEKKYYENQEMADMAENFNVLESEVVETLTNNPSFLDNVYKYLEWTKKRN